MANRSACSAWLSLLVLAAGLASVPAAAENRLGRQEERLAEAAADFQQGDYQSAWFRFWSLAHEGVASAQFNLGQLYRLGVGIPTELSIARYWYGEAAGQGHAYAQYNLGLMYELGHGTTSDLVETQAWYRRAVARDVPGASSALKRLEQRAREFVPAPRPSLSDARRPEAER
jgi:TPR repeat protein